MTDWEKIDQEVRRLLGKRPDELLSNSDYRDVCDMPNSPENEKRLAESAGASANPPAKPVDMGKAPSQLGGEPPGVPTDSLREIQSRIISSGWQDRTPLGPGEEGEKPVTPLDPEGGVLGKLGCLNVLLLLLLLIAALNS